MTANSRPCLTIPRDAVGLSISYADAILIHLLLIPQAAASSLRARNGNSERSQRCALYVDATLQMPGVRQM